MRESDSSRLVIRHTDLAMLNLNLFCMDRCGFLIAVRPVGAEQCRQRIRIIPVAVQAMAERASTVPTEQPKIITTEAVRASDVVITIGLRDTCSYSHGTRYEDWVSDHPAGQDLDHVRDQIRPTRTEPIAELISPRS